MISLFNAKARRDEVLTKNGIILDPICKSYTITEEVNGEFSFEGEFIIDKTLLPLETYNEITEDYIIRVPDETGDEVFRIASVRKTKKSIFVYARQITIADTLNLWLGDVRPTNISGSGAINWILSNATGDNEFVATSDITKINSATYEGVTVYEALGTAKNSFLERWGGEIIRRGYNLTINAQRGTNRGFKIISRKNLQGFEAKTNIDSLITVIYPKGYDGIKAESVKSQYFNNYSKPFPKEIKFDDVKVKSENDEEGFNTLAEAQAELKRLCELEFTDNKRDIIQATYNIKYAEIEKTEEYKELGITEKAFLGDIVTVYEETHDINIQVKAIGRKYDGIKKRRIETTLSNMDINLRPPTINDIIAEIGKGTEGTGNLGDYINSMITAGLKDSFVVMKPNELLIMDNKDINLAVNVCRFNKNGMAFSQNGYYGKYTFGFTIDGVINASLIRTGTLIADLIKAGKITSVNGGVVIDIEKDYIEVSHTDTDTKTQLNSEGFYILDENGDTIASLSSKKSWSELNVDKVFATNIENVYTGDANLYVNHSAITNGIGTLESPFNSYGALQDYINATPIINKDITINIGTVGAEITEVLELIGLSGKGAINIRYDKNAIQRNTSFNIVLSNIRNYVTLNGGRTGYNTNDGAILLDNGNGHGLKIENCSNVLIEYVNVNCLNWGMLITRSNVRAKRVDFCNCFCAVEGHGNVIHLEDCCGNAGSGGSGDAIRSYDGAIITYGHASAGCYVPVGALKQFNGAIIKLGTPNVTSSFRTMPTKPPTSDTYKDFKFTDYGYYSEGYNNWNSNGKTIYQGDWGYGNNRGVFTFDNTEINDFLNGATVLDGNTISLKRENAGGNSSSQAIYLCGTTHTSAGGSAPPVTKSYGNIGSLSWGQSGTFTLPKTFVQDLKSGIIKSVMFYTSNGGNYIKFSAVCTLRLKANK